MIVGRGIYDTISSSLKRRIADTRAGVGHHQSFDMP